MEGAHDYADLPDGSTGVEALTGADLRRPFQSLAKRALALNLTARSSIWPRRSTRLRTGRHR